MNEDMGLRGERSESQVLDANADDPCVCEHIIAPTNGMRGSRSHGDAARQQAIGGLRGAVRRTFDWSGLPAAKFAAFIG